MSIIEATPVHVDRDDLGRVEACIEAAIEYEKLLAAKQFRIRRLICNLKIKRDALEGLAESVWRGSA